MTDFSADERNAMRSYLQRSEVRLSTMHRVASAFLGGAGLLILFPVFFNQAISTLTSVLIRGASGHLIYSTIFLSVPLVLSVFIPLYALYFLLRDLVHFYFVGHSPGFPTKLFNPRFVLSGILFSPDESESVKHEVYVNQYGSDLVNFVVPFGEPQANYYSIIVTNTRGQILPEDRAVQFSLRQRV